MYALRNSFITDTYNHAKRLRHRQHKYLNNIFMDMRKFLGIFYLYIFIRIDVIECINF